MKGNFIIYDCETGGLECDKNPITEIGLLGVDVNLKEIARFSTFVKPYDDLAIGKKALEKTMVSMKQINGGMSVDEMVDVVIEFVKKIKGKSRSALMKPVLVGHGVAFDNAFLKRAFQRRKKDLSDFVSSNNGEILVIDTMQYARIVWGVDLAENDSDAWNLGKCCERAKIDLIDAHGAMNDALATHQLLKYFSSLSKQSSVEGVEVKQEKGRKFFKIG